METPLPYLLQDLGNPISINQLLCLTSVTREFANICDSDLRSSFVSLEYTNMQFNSLSTCQLLLISVVLNIFCQQLKYRQCKSCGNSNFGKPNLTIASLAHIEFLRLSAISHLRFLDMLLPFVSFLPK